MDTLASNHIIMARLDRIDANTRKSISWLTAIAVALAINILLVPYIKYSDVPVLTKGLEQFLAWEESIADEFGITIAKKITGNDMLLSKSKVKLAKYVEAVGKQRDLPKYYMATTASIESSLSPKADRCKGRNMCASARGLYQFILKTGRRLGLVTGNQDNRMNAGLSTRKAAQYAVQNKKILIRNGITVSGENLYLLHNQGDGALQILKLAEGKKAYIYPKMYSNILNNCGRFKKRIKAIGRPTKEVARLFLKYRKETWDKNYNYIKRKLG